MKNDLPAPPSDLSDIHLDIPAHDEVSHSLSAGIRAAGGGATGAAIGIAIGGPVGGVIGAAIGALAGELSGNVSTEIAAPSGPPSPPAAPAIENAGREAAPTPRLPLPELVEQSAEPEERVPVRTQIDPQVEYALPPSDEEEIAALAWYFYETEGRPQGRALIHWLRAERETREGRQGGPSPVEA